MLPNICNLNMVLRPLRRWNPSCKRFNRMFWNRRFKPFFEILKFHTLCPVPRFLSAFVFPTFKPLFEISWLHLPLYFPHFLSGLRPSFSEPKHTSLSTALLVLSCLALSLSCLVVSCGVLCCVFIWLAGRKGALPLHVHSHLWCAQPGASKWGGLVSSLSFTSQLLFEIQKFEFRSGLSFVPFCRLRTTSFMTYSSVFGDFDPLKDHVETKKNFLLVVSRWQKLKISLTRYIRIPPLPQFLEYIYIY